MRTALRFVNAVINSPCDVSVCVKNRKINGKSIVGLMSACIGSGESFFVECTGNREEETMQAVERCIARENDNYR